MYFILLVSKGPTTTSSAILLVPFTKFVTIIFYYHYSCYFMLCINFVFVFVNLNLNLVINSFIHSFIHSLQHRHPGSKWSYSPFLRLEITTSIDGFWQVRFLYHCVNDSDIPGHKLVPIDVDYSTIIYSPFFVDVEQRLRIRYSVLLDVVDFPITRALFFV